MSKNYTNADKLKIINDYNYIISYQSGGVADVIPNVEEKKPKLEDTVKKGMADVRKGLTMFKDVIRKGKDIAKIIEEDPALSRLKKEALKHSEIKKVYDVSGEIGTRAETIVKRADELVGDDTRRVDAIVK